MLLLLLTGLLLSACMQRTSRNSSLPALAGESPAVAPAPTGSGETPLAAFQRTVYTITRAKCIACHNSPPLTAGMPEHAADDVNVAYDWAKNRVGAGTGNNLTKFLDIPSSELVIHAGNGHCGLYCMPSQGTQTDMIAAIQAWVDVELGT